MEQVSQSESCSGGWFSFCSAKKSSRFLDLDTAVAIFLAHFFLGLKCFAKCLRTCDRIAGRCPTLYSVDWIVSFTNKKSVLSVDLGFSVLFGVLGEGNGKSGSIFASYQRVMLLSLYGHGPFPAK